MAQADAKKLMAEGVLAKPIPEDVQTNIKPEFDEKDYQKWASKAGDLPEQIITSLAENESRNRAIITHYVKNKTKYGKTIMFASRWHQCEALEMMLRKQDIRVDSVYSHVESRPKSADARNNLKEDHNARVIESFKNNELDVLINVQMLTEGTDVPDAQTVFLTRQTTSEILLKQMVGRALRGPKFGGTKDAYIVSFIDEWRHHIDWATYDQIVEAAYSDDIRLKYGRRPLQLISIKLVQDLVSKMDSGLNINTTPYESFMPIGWYKVVYDAVVDNDNTNVADNANADDTEPIHDLIIVYDNDEKPLKEFISKLKKESEYGNLRDFERPDLKTSEQLDEKLKSWLENDIPDVTIDKRALLSLVRHIAQQNGDPIFISFKERDDHDLDIIASKYIDENLGPRKINERLWREYTNSKRLWQSLYTNYVQFKSAYDACENRITNENTKNEDRSESYTTPEDIPKSEPHDKIKEKVKAQDNHCCVCCGSKTRLEIDHIKSNYQSGDHKIENLQTLCWICNRQKGLDTINFRYRITRLPQCPDQFPNLPLPDQFNNNQLKQYLKRSVNFFYRCSAVWDISITSAGICSIYLCWGHDPNWLRPHIPELINRIRESGYETAFKEIEIEGGSKFYS